MNEKTSRRKFLIPRPRKPSSASGSSRDQLLQSGSRNQNEPVPTLASPFPEVGDPLIKQLWQEAFNRISPDEKKLFDDIIGQPEPLENGVDPVIAAIRRKQALCDQKQWTFKFRGRTIKLREVAEKIISWLDRFKTIGDVAANANPIMAGLPWAGIRLLLQTAVSESQMMASLLLGVDKIIYILTQCRIYEKLYLFDQPSMEAGIRAQRVLFLGIRDMYTLVFHFLSAASRVYSQSTILRGWKALWRVEDITVFEDRLREREDGLAKDAQHCEFASNRGARTRILENLKDLKNMNDVFYGLESRVNALWKASSNQMRAEILKWITQIPYEDDHYSARQDRTKGTGEWLLQRKEYLEWINSNESRILWVHGIPGSGKTKLASKVIDQFQNQPDLGMAYFYCNRKDGGEESRQDPDNILKSYVKQLAARDQSLHNSLVEVYQKKKNSGFGSSTLSLDECRRILLDLIKTYPQTFLILDALDESDERKRAGLIDLFNDFVKLSERLKVIIFSRRDEDITKQLTREKNIGIEATDNQNDIEKYVEERVALIQKRRRVPLSKELCQKIIQILFEKSQGMFQWAALTLEQIGRLKLARDIEERLGRLPRDLKAAYDEIFDQILNGEGSQPEVATRAFHWIAVSMQPLTVEALVTAVCQNPKTETIGPVNIDIDDVLDACHNLVVVQNGRCAFSHLSVREYIRDELNDKWTLADAHATVAEVSLSLLCQENGIMMSDHCCDEIYYCNGHLSLCMKSSGLPSDFHLYIMRHWYRHVQFSGDRVFKERLHSLCEKFFGTFDLPSPIYLAWRSRFDGIPELVRTLQCLGLTTRTQARSYKISPFEFICVAKLGEYLEYELDKGNALPGDLEIEGMPAFIFVAMSGSQRTMQHFFQKKISTNQKLENDSLNMALACAANYRNFEMAQLLIDNGADCNSNIPVGEYGSPLVAAVICKRNQDVIRLLLQSGADVNKVLIHGYYGSALCAAVCSQDAKNIVQLLEAGGRANMCLSRGNFGSALCAAAYCGNSAIIRQLLKAGADPNMQLSVGEHGSALCAAIRIGNAAAVKLLLEAGADVNAPLTHGKFGSVLCTAAYYKTRGILKVLLKAGAEVNMRLVGGKYGSALAAAVTVTRDTQNDGFDIGNLTSGDIWVTLDTIDILLEWGADINMQFQGHSFGSALVAAVATAEREVVGALIESGADVDLGVNGEFRTARDAIEWRKNWTDNPLNMTAMLVKWQMFGKSKRLVNGKRQY